MTMPMRESTSEMSLIFADLRLAYSRGPEGIIVGLAEQLGVGVPAYNESQHRMSGTGVNLKYEHRRMPLIGALVRRLNGGKR